MNFNRFLEEEDEVMERAQRIETCYNAFREMSKIVHASIKVEEVLELAVWKASEILNAKGALLRLLNLETQEMELSAAYGLSEEYLSKGPVTRSNIINDLDSKKKAIIIDDIASDPRVQYPKEALKEGIRMFLDLPLLFQDGVAGILRVFFATQRDFFEEEIDFTISLGELCSCAIGKARLIESQKSQYDQLALHTEKLAALGRMAAGIAHEINNPLAGILLFSSNLVKKADPGPIKEGLEIIMQETQRCKFIIQELLEFTRDRESQKTMANINTIIEKSLSILENEFRLRHIQLRKKLSTTMMDTMLDGHQLEQVFVNVLLNAIQAIDRDGVVTVVSQAAPRQEFIVVEIEDTGSGIPEENLDKIFEPFFSTKKEGTGLGLAVSYGVIQNHQGHIKVNSELGKGTRFRITLPALKGAVPDGQ
jgi:two-component system, NtrC family, sensor kinase